MTIAKEGFPFIFIPLVIGLAFIFVPCLAGLGVLAVYICLGPGILLALFSLFCLFFFRDPKIKVTQGEGIILSPCNGTVMEIVEKDDEKILRVFLSIFNVHLQRAPLSGTVRSVEHKDGSFLAAWNPRAQSENEQNSIIFEGAQGAFTVRQIAGFLARRCVSWVKAGDTVKAGDKIGLIKFSSQVDLHLPKKAVISVKPEDKVRAVITILGELK
ncbi:phosphatidylserine decarboxylase proenzyme [Spirochaetia bacterium]|nr:phosphatidylserine decarboxylase proenzyme [Spirochaetia bacterium]